MGSSGNQAGGLRALVVDDESLPRDVFGAYLRRLGFHVLSAANVVDALRLLDEAALHLVLLDRRMPGVNGEDAAGLIRGHPNGAEAFLVGISADSDPAMVEAWKARGLDEFRVKPLNFEVMREIVSGASRKSGARLPEPTGHQPCASTSPVVNMAVWQDIAALGERTGSELKARMLLIFEESANRLLSELGQAARSADRQQMERSAHALTGCAVTVGACQLAERARALRMAAHTAPCERLDVLCAEVTRACQVAQAALLSLHLDD